jgi:HK97 family phage major capsid protein
MEPNFVDEIKQLLAEVQAQLTITGEDGTPVKLTDALKGMPELNLKYADLVKRIEHVEKMAQNRKWADIPGVDEGKEKFSFFKVFRAIKSGDWKEAGYEKSVMDEARKRDLSYADDGTGGYLVPAQAFSELIEMLRAEAVCMKLGARMIDNLQGAPVLFPAQTGGCTVYWVADNAAVNPSDLAFGQLSLSPKKAMALVPLSNTLMRLSQPSAEAIVRQDVALQMALALDLAGLRGTGLNNQPKGIANTPNIPTYEMGTNGLEITNLDLFAELEYKLAAANALRGKLGFAFHPVTKKNMKKIKVAEYWDVTNTKPGDAVEPMIFPFTDQALEAALGYPFATTTQIPIDLEKGTADNCTEVYFGNWAELLFGQWAGLRIDASQQAGTSFAMDQTWIRIIAELDVAVRHLESFVLCNDVLTGPRVT